MTEKWTRKFELEYARAHDYAFFHDVVKTKWDLFGCEWILRKHFGNTPIRRAIDIGGGRIGGALGFVSIKTQRLLVDALAHEFKRMGDLPSETLVYTCDFADIPLISNTAEVVFAWNVFDRARDIGHFVAGLKESQRILAPNGLFFGSFPLRREPRNGHPICLSILNIERIKQYLDLRMIRDFIVGSPLYDDEVYFYVGLKCE